MQDRPTTFLSRRAVSGGGITRQEIENSTTNLSIAKNIKQKTVAAALATIMAVGAMPGKADAINLGEALANVIGGAAAGAIAATIDKKSVGRGAAVGAAAGLGTAVISGAISELFKDDPKKQPVNINQDPRVIQQYHEEMNRKYGVDGRGPGSSSPNAQLQEIRDARAAITANQQSDIDRKTTAIFSRSKLTDEALEAMKERDRKIQELEREQREIMSNPMYTRPMAGL